MLVLSRKKNETILIGDGIEVRIASVQGGRVKVGIDAPAEMRIRRGELVLDESGGVDCMSEQATCSPLITNQTW